MQYPEEKLISAMKTGGVDFLCTLPCDRVKSLIAIAEREFPGVPLTREEEGVGICAGAAMAGKHPAMVVQSSGVGNMVNALMSLTSFYELPLAMFVSWRGVYKEGIAAQVPMGKALPGILGSLGMDYTGLNDFSGLESVGEILRETYAKGSIHFFLLSPALWEASGLHYGESTEMSPCEAAVFEQERSCPRPSLRRYDMLRKIASALAGRVVVCNLGIPSKELYSLLHQPSNFYMLGSMGMATPLGLGVALSQDKEVIVIDGDGSLLMNPGSLATVAHTAPDNFKILAIDNASYGSTGSQTTHTSSCTDLEAVARGFGIRNTFKAASAEDIKEILSNSYDGPLFVHALTFPGNESVPDIPLGHLEIRDGFSRFLQGP